MKRPFVSPVALVGILVSLVTLGWLSWIVYNFSSTSAAYSIFGDEGVFLTGADRILQGEMPYRDFITYLSPGAYYPLAGFFHLFGENYVVARTFLLLNIIGIIAAMYWLAWPLLRWWSFLPVVVFSFLIFPAWPFVSHHWQFLVFALLSTCCLFYRTVRWRIVGGILAGISFAVFPEKGIFVLAAHVTILTLTGFRNVRSLIAPIVTYVVSFSLPVVAGVWWLVSNGVWRSFLQQAFVDMITYYPKQVQPFAFFTFNNIAFLTFLGFIGLGLVLMINRRLSAFPWKPFATVYLLHIFLSFSVWYHIELYHLLQIIAPFTILMFAAVLVFFRNRKAILQTYSMVGTAALAFSTIVVSVSVLFALAFQSSYGAGMGMSDNFSRLSTLRGNIALNHYKTPALVDEYATVSQLATTTLAGKHVFFLPYAPGFYYFLGLRNVTSFDFMVTDTIPPAYFEKFKKELENIDAVVFLLTSWQSFDTQGAIMQMIRESFLHHQELLQGRVQVFSRTPL
ncbi:MAG: hypothetical protein V1685_05200 [Parcubacteria group bacterium]